MQRQIPNLLFSTRSPDPRSGSDFVRQVVAESPGVSETARREFARRSDIAGAVLQSGFEHPLYFFTALPDEHAWLFARVRTLGLYRKGSQHLMVHGMVLDEEILEWLEGNPFLLDGEALGTESPFRAEHPGRETRLPSLPLDKDVAADARKRNLQRLESLATSRQTWFPAAYGALAAGDPLACLAVHPRPEPIEGLLLHFHQDDRMALSFQTFYSHSRQVPYRLMGVVPEDLSLVRSHFPTLATVELAATPPAETQSPSTLGLGRSVARLAGASGTEYLATLDQYRLTHISSRKMPPMSPREAALVLQVAGGKEPTAAEKQRLIQLSRRGIGGLALQIAELARVWTEAPAQFTAVLQKAAAVSEKLTERGLDRYLDTLPTDHPPEERFVLAALLEQDQALAPGEGWGSRRRAVWARLVPPPDLRAFLAALAPDQRELGLALVQRYAVDALRTGEPLDGGDPPYWHTLLSWLHGLYLPEARILEALEAVEGALAVGPAGETAARGWRRLGEFHRHRGDHREALYLLLTRELPLLDDSKAGKRLQPTLPDVLYQHPELLVELAGQLHRPGVAARLFQALAELLLDALPTAHSLIQPLRTLLEGADELSPAEVVAGSCGLFLARWEFLFAQGLTLPWTLDRCTRLLPENTEDSERFPGRVLATAVDELLHWGRGPLAPEQEERLIDAIANCLDVRGRFFQTADTDRQLMSLAVLGRVLAQNHPGESADRLATRWATHLNRLLDGPLGRQPPVEARWWHARLRDELVDHPPVTETDRRFELYLRLGWTLWSLQPKGSRYRSALALRLRRATGLIQTGSGGRWRLGKLLSGSGFEADRFADWYLEKLPELVPGTHREEAERLLKPIEIRVPPEDAGGSRHG